MLRVEVAVQLTHIVGRLELARDYSIGGDKMNAVDIPTFDALMNPVIQALKELGGSGTIEEINNKVIEIADLSDEQTEVLHKPEKGGGRTEVEYRLAWTRTYLKKYGLLDNSSRGVWTLTPEGREVDRVNPKQVRRSVQKQSRKVQEESEEVELDEEEAWRDELLEALLEMEPAAFERLVQRLLRESGFIKVEVTGRSGDGGVDGKGVMRLGGLLSFHVIFQCKRYRGSVSVSQVRDFRGAMVGRADKGLLITAGNFTRDAMREAVRDGAPAIDLIDGDLLLEKLKELGLGVRTEVVQTEQITVDRQWFESI
jgi:restriction system protein